uniref:C-type lectin domain family 9 member A-like n=1 Tax=Oncorhynchus gorbuscha TaxID=8017 RepID=UPI001EAF8ABF|nr:C-type lectin domain family 9 member A-like [Oncorhynchus gorbuscha]
MAEELHYSSVVFKNPIVSSPKEKKEEETAYAEVKAKGSAVTQQNPATAVDEKSALHSQPFRGPAVCLGLLCALLVSAIIGLCVYFSTALSEHNTKLVGELAANQDLMNLNSNLSRANHILQSDYTNVSTTNRRLAAEKEHVSRERDRLNWNLQFIFQFDDFPVKKYCSQNVGSGERVCNSCQDSWILFQSSCYLIVQYDPPWKTWTESQQYCKQENADLPVIGSRAEQEFIHNHTKEYYDKYHGYWIGLTDKAEEGKWLWVNGGHQNLTDGFWNSQTGGDCVLTIPSNAPLANWNAVRCDMQNSWICESRALIWSD